ncbi:unnamed protein product [Phytophthora lilii]|uniref:Unnamed protein product n=1 Tax=Phytophthora lilii TaxID=2077276 RepID=A0A9W6U4P4_9STRA|nr:unnamed protein product [Phytophthora lilii]
MLTEEDRYRQLKLQSQNKLFWVVGFGLGTNWSGYELAVPHEWPVSCAAFFSFKEHTEIKTNASSEKFVGNARIQIASTAAPAATPTTNY